MAVAANRGKYAEGQFRKVCKECEGKANFAFHRFPDAHSGSMVTAPADFQTLYAGRMRLIEVKETKETNRLPYNNFASDQVARMRMWALAGAESWVLVYHTETKLYRLFAAEQFLERQEGSGSWFFEQGRTKSMPLKPYTEGTNLREVFNFIHGM